jgi:hypothetical protein
MHAILEWSQQFFVFFVILWPIWLVILVIGSVGKYNKNIFLQTLSKRLFIGIGALLLLTRLLIFAVFPYGNISEEYSFSLPADKSKIIVVDHNYGDLKVSYGKRETFLYEGKDLRGRKKFKESKVINNKKSGERESYDAIQFDSFSAIPIIGTVSSQTILTIPDSVTENLFITMQETDAVVDLSLCQAKEIQILAAYSKLQIILPSVASNQHINLVTRVSQLSIAYTKGTSVRLLEGTRTTTKRWDDFDNVDSKYYEYMSKGASRDSPTITVELTYSKPELVLKQISGHND